MRLSPWRYVWLIGGTLVLLFSLARCGSLPGAKKAKHTDNEGTAPVSSAGQVPPTWDGASDWSSSPFEVVEE